MNSDHLTFTQTRAPISLRPAALRDTHRVRPTLARRAAVAGTLSPTSVKYLQRHVGNESIAMLINSERSLQLPAEDAAVQEAQRDGPSAPPPSSSAALRLQLRRGPGNADFSHVDAVSNLHSGAAPMPGNQDEGALARFPHSSPIEHLLGVPVPGRALVDAAGCNRAGSVAYTDGATTRFASADPPIEVAAHEAVHQLQHIRATNDLGLDPEQHAAAVEHRVRDGGNAAALLGRTGSPVPVIRRPYTKIPKAAQLVMNAWKAGVDLRVSDDGHMAAEQRGSYGTHNLWASPDLVTSANSSLKGKGSEIRLELGTGVIEGSAPHMGKGPRELDMRQVQKVEPKNDTKMDIGVMQLWADCGHAAREVMGVGGGSGEHSDKVAARALDPPGRPGEFHPRAPTDRSVKVSLHSARLIRSRMRSRSPRPSGRKGVAALRSGPSTISGPS